MFNIFSISYDCFTKYVQHALISYYTLQTATYGHCTVTILAQKVLLFIFFCFYEQKPMWMSVPLYSPNHVTRYQKLSFSRLFHFFCCVYPNTHSKSRSSAHTAHTSQRCYNLRNANSKAKCHYENLTNLIVKCFSRIRLNVLRYNFPNFLHETAQTEGTGRSEYLR